jgi:uncharacterized membrane protein
VAGRRPVGHAAVMPVALHALIERARGSLFLVPTLFVIGAVAVGEITLVVDQALSDRSQLPLVSEATVDNARAVLSTIATATVTIAGIAFSVSLLVIQLASSQYSPRVVHNLVRDPFSKRVMGIVLGTFTYCLVVLRSVRGPLDDGGDAIVPTISLTIAVVLGVVAVLAIVAFINHSAHSMDISELLHEVTRSSLLAAEHGWPDRAEPADSGGHLGPAEPPPGDGFRVAFAGNGWIQRLDADGLLALVPPGGVVLVHVAVGRYAVADTPLCTVWPPPPEGDRSTVEAAAREAALVGRTRTMRQDASYGVRQLVDVALRALSPGVNDPTTAQDAIFHLAAVLREVLERPEPPQVRIDGQGRRLLQPELPTHRSVVGLAFDELRPAAAPHPTVCVYLLEAMHLLCQSLPTAPATGAVRAIEEQARLVVEASQAADVIDHDRQRVVSAYEQRFGARRPQAGPSGSSTRTQRVPL